MTEVGSHSNEAKSENASYLRIFSGTAIIGGASITNILIGLLRIKLIALLLGPAGIGLIGLYTAVMSTAATVTQLGVGMVGTRQIAKAHADADSSQLAVARRALFAAAVFLSVLGGVGVWLMRDMLARWVLNDPAASNSVAWFSIGVALSVASASQSAVIQGMRRIGDLAAITILSAILTTFIGVPLLWWLGARGIALYVILGPATAFFLGHIFVAKLPKLPRVKIAISQLNAQWLIFLRIGLPYMGAALATTTVDLWIRTSIQRQLGVEALGHFQASWTIAMQYVGFVLGAMAADYYPRLAGIMNRPAAACHLVNQQTEAALLLSGSAILALLSMAPWVITLLYSPEFTEAADVLQWQVLGTLLKVVSWPLGFIILAQGAGRTFFLTETTTLLLMAGLITYLIPELGLKAAGVGYFAAYIYYLPLLYILAARRIGFRWSRDVMLAFGLLLIFCTGIVTTILAFPAWTAPVGSVAALIFGAFAVHRVNRVGVINIEQIVAKRFCGWKSNR